MEFGYDNLPLVVFEAGLLSESFMYALYGRYLVTALLLGPLLGSLVLVIAKRLALSSLGGSRPRPLTGSTIGVLLGTTTRINHWRTVLASV